MLFSHLWDIATRRRDLRTHKSSVLIFLGILIYLSSLTSACAPTGTIQPTHTLRPSRTPIKLGPTSTMTPESPTPVPPIPSPTLVPLLPISDEDWSRGPEDASFTFVVYADFQ